MKLFSIIAVPTLTLAAAAPARVVSLGGEPLAALPGYDVAAGAGAAVDLDYEGGYNFYVADTETFFTIGDFAAF